MVSSKIEQKAEENFASTQLKPDDPPTSTTASIADVGAALQEFARQMSDDAVGDDTSHIDGSHDDDNSPSKSINYYDDDEVSTATINHNEEEQPEHESQLFELDQTCGKELLFSMMFNTDNDKGKGNSPFTNSPTLEQLGLGLPLVANVMSLAQVPFTHEINVKSLSPSSGLSEGFDCESMGPDIRIFADAEGLPGTACSSIAATERTVGTFKVTQNTTFRIWRQLSLPEPLSAVHTSKRKRYPNTPLSIAWYEHDTVAFFIVGLLLAPNLLKILPPKFHQPDKLGRFNVLPIDSQRYILADESSHQILLVNAFNKTRKHLAGCGKRGYMDGPLEVCRLNSPCSMALDPHSHHIYVADKGNHVIRKIDLLSGLVSTVAGSGCRGNSDGANRRRQALDSPFKVSFVEPNQLIISCADNSIRRFNLKTEYLETLLVGS